MPSSGFQTCARSEAHTSELQSHDNLVCRLLLEKTNRTRSPCAPACPPLAAVPTRTRPATGGAIGCGGPSSDQTGKGADVVAEISAFFFNFTAPPGVYGMTPPGALRV